jgi:hypothetical protein
MKNFPLLLISTLLFISCSKTDSDNDVKDNVELNFTQFEATLSSGKKSIGVIDEINKQISLPNITDPLEIVSVIYRYSDAVSIITPNPDTRIGKWELIEKFRLHSGENYEEYTVEIVDFEEPTYNQATIAPLETFGTTIKYHMIDLNEDPTDITVAKANVGFNEKGMNGIRFPLYCGDKFGGHPSEGVVLEDVYIKPLTSLENAKAAYSGSEPFMIFLGIKVLTSNKAEMFPDWVTTDKDDIPNPEKYAQLIVDFITFMDKKGHTINAFAFDKESVRMGIDDFKIAVDTLRARTARLGFVVPKIVAPELLDPQGDKPSGYMNTLYNKGFQDRYDIFGNHYYQRDHTEDGFAKLKYEFDLAQSDKARSQWATEPHWNGDPDVWVAETAIGAMFDHTDLGLEAFMWWDYPITGGVKPKQSIMRAYSDAIHRSTPIRMIDHDGEETFTKGKLHTRAYIRGNEVNVFLINVVNPNIAGLVPISYEDYVVGVLDDFKIDGNVIVRQWRDDISVEGEYSSIEPVSDNQLLLDIPTGSFIQLTFEITN